MFSDDSGSYGDFDGCFGDSLLRGIVRFSVLFSFGTYEKNLNPKRVYIILNMEAQKGPSTNFSNYMTVYIYLKANAYCIIAPNQIK